MTKTIALISLGGTIAMMPDSGKSGGVVPSLDAAALSAQILDDYFGSTVEVEPFSFRQVGSANLTTWDIDALVHHINSLDVDGVVVTQGTDSMEETSFFMRLRYDGETPVVFTGAMRSPNFPGADGPANLVDAVQAAMAEGMPPVSVMMNKLLHDPAFIRKAHSHALEAFTSDGAELAHMIEGSLTRRRPATALPVFASSGETIRPLSVGHVVALMDAPAETLSAYEGFDALVVEAFGAGHVSEAWSDTLAELAAKMPVVLASRCGRGPVLEETYGYKGAERDLIARGLEPAGWLDGRKARMALIGIGIANFNNWRHHFRSIRAALAG